jgi:hypothetical protein
MFHNGPDVPRKDIDAAGAIVSRLGSYAHTLQCVLLDAERSMTQRDETRSQLSVLLHDYFSVSSASKCGEYIYPSMFRKS